MPNRRAERGAFAFGRSLPAHVVGALLLGLAGCASVVPRGAGPPAVEVPAAWSVASAAGVAGATPLAQWWERFDDPLLGSLVNRALQANTSVRSAQGTLTQARALRDVAAAALLPSLGSSASAQRSRSGLASGASSNSFRAGLDASWEPDFFGLNRSARDASDASAQASAASLGDVRVAIAAEVALNYITLRSGQVRLAIASDNLASQQETLQITQWRLQAGLVSALEAEQALGAVAQTRAQLPLLQAGIEQSRHALAVLIGLPPAALAGELAASGPVPLAPADLALALPAETLRQRPDVRAAEHQVTAALARVAQADAARAPNFRLSGTLGLSALTLGALTNGASVLGSLLAGVSMPLFDGGAATAQVRAQQAALEQARVAYQATVLAALKDVEDALAALRGDRERQLQLQQAAQAAANAALLARQRFASGLVDFQTVLETQRTQLGTQDSLATAGASVGADHVRLYKALGGGWRAEGSGTIAAQAEPRTTPK